MNPSRPKKRGRPIGDNRTEADDVDDNRNESSAKNSDGEPAAKKKHSAVESAMANKSNSSSGSGKRQQNKKAKRKRIAKFGNYDRYYEYRVRKNRCRSGNRAEIWQDNRLEILKREYFFGKRCLDIGCNAGYLTINIAMKYHCSYMLGVDIDPKLIGKARKMLATKAHEQACLAQTGSCHVHHMIVDGKKQRIPIALSMCEGEVYPDLEVTSSANAAPSESTATAGPNILANSASSSAAASAATGLAGGKFPGNCFFKCEDFVNATHGNMKKYDVITCMSVTKWVHLNCGDGGIKTLFKKCFDMLSPGGSFIVEPQQWRSYKKNRNVSEKIGFSSMQTLRTPSRGAKGFRKRPIHQYIK